jgi:hypothetical protein
VLCSCSSLPARMACSYSELLQRSTVCCDLLLRRWCRCRYHWQWLWLRHCTGCRLQLLLLLLLLLLLWLLLLLLLLCRAVVTRDTWCFRCDPYSVPTSTSKLPLILPTWCLLILPLLLLLLLLLLLPPQAYIRKPPPPRATPSSAAGHRQRNARPPGYGLGRGGGRLGGGPR